MEANKTQTSESVLGVSREFWIHSVKCSKCLIPYLPLEIMTIQSLCCQGAAPVNSKPYRYSPLQKERQVLVMLQSRLITRGVSPFASPALLVKKDGSWRFCVDYRKLNGITVKNKFPMPIIDEFLDELAGATCFSKLDMASVFHQIRMAEGDEGKTTFKNYHGHFQFRVMPFGLTNAPATFQCLMNVVLQLCMRKFVLIFMDDKLVYSHTLEAHAIHL